MNLPLIITKEARADIRDLTLHYAAIRRTLADAFGARLDEALMAVANAPESFPILQKKRIIRRVLLKQFSYAVFFRTLPTQIEVFAVLHTARSPSLWKRRGRT
jgi:plasmid stabilization system protein ParE